MKQLLKVRDTWSATSEYGRERMYEMMVYDGIEEIFNSRAWV